MTQDFMNEVYSVRGEDNEGSVRLGPYFGKSQARAEAKKAQRKGLTIISIDKAVVEWIAIETI